MVPLNIFDQIAGLPLHPLVVHAAVVLIPLSVLALIAVIAIPKLRGAYALLTVAGLVAGTGALIISKESGEQLAEHVGLPARHAQLAEILTIISVALTAVAIVWWWLQRQGPDAKFAALTRWVGVAALLLTVPTLVLIGLVGHSGAQAAWGGRLGGESTTTASAPASVPAASPSRSSVAPSSAASSPAASATSAAADYTLAQVAEHASAQSCWAAVNGKVYDLTSWIDLHPGGAPRILQICGTDSTQAFTAQHARNQDANQELAQFEIGTLAG